MIKVAFDMETSDPDDVCALLFLCYHPQIELEAVTVTPGTKDQIGLVKGLLNTLYNFNYKIPVGSRKPDHPKDCVSGFFRKNYEILPAEPDGLGWEVLANFFRKNKDGVLLTGASLGNPAEMLRQTEAEDLCISRWVGQGGFAGDSVVPPEHRLKKFEGKETCPTFNFNGDVPGAKLMLATDRIGRKELVSKNVCHGVIYNKAMHEEMKQVKLDHPAYNEMLTLMDKYLEGHSDGKMYHDPLAATTILAGDVCGYKRVEVYREKGEWGSRIEERKGLHFYGNTFISILVQLDRFKHVLKGGI